MPPTLISRSKDLRKLEQEGYEVEVKSGHLLLNNVPYVAPDRTIKRGVLVTSLSLEGDIAARPGTHVAMFVGDMPCNKQGSPLVEILLGSGRHDLGGGLLVDHHFSSKPPGGYTDYYHLMTTYEAIISGLAQLIDPTVTSRTFAVVEDTDEDSVFNYVDTASSRVGIGAVTEKLKIGPVAIIGLGGTGSYILDLVAKTPVKEIHLFDGDRFGQHNAFRSPGAPSIEMLKSALSKVDYLRDIYSNMRINIFSHGYVDESTVGFLTKMNFVFVAVDKGRPRKLAIDILGEFGIPFIDVGMGVHVNNGSILGQLRVTAGIDKSRNQVLSNLPLSDRDDDDEYSRNIQIADLNALNAALAVIKWKKYCGFYTDLEREHSILYQIDGNCLINEVKI